MKFKAIIFDMDGTIVDSSEIWRTATQNLIKLKIACEDPELFKHIDSKVHGLAMHKTCAVIKDIMNLEDSVEALIAQKIEIVTELFNGGVEFIPGFVDFHKDVLDSDLKTGIATNADDNTLFITKKILQLEEYFGEHIYNITCVDNVCKPHPAIYLHAAKQLDVDPKECIAIEDSAHGVASAKAAGMFCIGINTSGDINQVKDSHLIIDKYSDIDLQKILAKQ